MVYGKGGGVGVGGVGGGGSACFKYAAGNCCCLWWQSLPTMVERSVTYLWWYKLLLLLLLLFKLLLGNCGGGSCNCVGGVRLCCWLVAIVAYWFDAVGCCCCCSCLEDDIGAVVENVMVEARHDGQSSITTCGSMVDRVAATRGLANAILRHGLRAARLKSAGGSTLRVFLKYGNSFQHLIWSVRASCNAVGLVLYLLASVARK